MQKSKLTIILHFIELVRKHNFYCKIIGYNGVEILLFDCVKQEYLIENKDIFFTDEVFDLFKKEENFTIEDLLKVDVFGCKEYASHLIDFSKPLLKDQPQALIDFLYNLIHIPIFNYSLERIKVRGNLYIGELPGTEFENIKSRMEWQVQEIETNKNEVIYLCRNILSHISEDEDIQQRQYKNTLLNEKFSHEYYWQHSSPFKIINRTIEWHNEIPNSTNRFYTKKEYAYKFLELWEQMPINQAETQWVEWVEAETKF